MTTFTYVYSLKTAPIQLQGEQYKKENASQPKKIHPHTPTKNDNNTKSLQQLLFHPLISPLHHTQTKDKLHQCLKHRMKKKKEILKPEIIPKLNKIIWTNGAYATFTKIYIKNARALPTMHDRVDRYPNPNKITRYRKLPKYRAYDS